MPSEIGLRAQWGTHQAFRDQSLLIVTPDGDVPGDGLSGLYYANTRLLSRLSLRVNREKPFTVQVGCARADLLVAVFQDPRITGDEALQDRALVLQLTVGAGRGFHIDLDAQNHSLQALEFDLALLLDADFADLEEARRGQDASKIEGGGEPGGARQQEAPVRRTGAPDRSGDLRFDYRHPDLREAVALRFSPAPHHRDGGAAWRLTLAPQGEWHACIEVAPIHLGEQITPDARCYGERKSGGAAADWVTRATRLEAANDGVRRAYERAVADLDALALHTGSAAERPAMAAGVPFYQNPFGRDLLTAGWQSLLATPALVESAILVCERYQGVRDDDFRDEQPGRIIQQVRSGPLNLLNRNPRGRYYSDYASPGDFLIALGQHFMWTGDRDFLLAHLPAARRVLRWLDRRADLDGDGFYEYQTRSPQGDRNQGWKGSERGIPAADGSQPPLPIATSEVQGFVYAGKQQLGAALLMAGKPWEGLRLLRQAAGLKRRFAEAFWMPEQRSLAMALDGNKRWVASAGSNAGLCLATGIVAKEHAPAVVARLMASDMFSGWGVRTLSAEHPAYNPLAYHLGSVWTVEQGTIAFGLTRYGYSRHACAVARGTFDLAERYALHRLPEAVGGFPRDRRHPFPAQYPQACWPQAWSSSAVIVLIQAMLGLRPVAPLGLLLVDPELPEWLPAVTLRGLRVGDSVLTVEFRRRRDGRTRYRVVDRRGRVRVLRAPPGNSVCHGLARRIAEPLLAAISNGM